MADELPEVGAFNQQPTLADIGKSSAATSLGSIGSLINLLTAKNTTDNMPEYMSILSPDFKPSGTDLPDIEYFKEVFGAPETLNIGDFVNIDPFSKVLAGGKGIMAMVPFINKDGVNITKLFKRIDELRYDAQRFLNEALETGSSKSRKIYYNKIKKADELENNISPEDVIGNKEHIAAQSTKEGANKGLAEIRKSLGIDPKKKQFKELASKGQIHQARTNKESIKTIKNKETPAQDFNIQEMSDDVGLDYEAGDFTKQFEDAGLHVIDDNMGRVIVGRTKKDAMNLLNAKTPIEYGKAYGYSDADIAQFYITRSGGNIDYGYKEFTKDLLDTYK